MNRRLALVVVDMRTLTRSLVDFRNPNSNLASMYLHGTAYQHERG